MEQEIEIDTNGNDTIELNDLTNKIDDSSQFQIDAKLYENIVAKRDAKINYGDLVILYETRESVKYFILEKGKVSQNRFGAFKHDDIYGKSFGSKIYSMKKDGYVTVLGFVTHLWERCINKMTQILFNPDISMIMTFLNIRNDSVIYESGTGSGCLSTNMSQVLSSGHLYTFEFNKERQGKLSNLFKTIGVDKSITVIYRDVVESGFEVPSDLLVKQEHERCDGIFIDLPTPWLVIDKVKKVLKSGGAFVSFSPCIEQVDETMKVLRDSEFLNPRMFECVYRSYNYTRTARINVPQLGEKRKFGQITSTIEKEVNLNYSRSDMRGHTGFLVYAINL